MAKLLKWQEAETKRIENLGHTDLVDDLLDRSKTLYEYGTTRDYWICDALEKELRHRLQIFYNEDAESPAHGSHFIRWKP